MMLITKALTLKMIALNYLFCTPKLLRGKLSVKVWLLLSFKDS